MSSFTELMKSKTHALNKLQRRTTAKILQTFSGDKEKEDSHFETVHGRFSMYDSFLAEFKATLINTTKSLQLGVSSTNVLTELMNSYTANTCLGEPLDTLTKTFAQCASGTTTSSAIKRLIQLIETSILAPIHTDMKNNEQTDKLLKRRKKLKLDFDFFKRSSNTTDPRYNEALRKFTSFQEITCCHLQNRCVFREKLITHSLVCLSSAFNNYYQTTGNSFTTLLTPNLEPLQKLCITSEQLFTQMQQSMNTDQQQKTPTTQPKQSKPQVPPPQPIHQPKHPEQTLKTLPARANSPQNHSSTQTKQQPNYQSKQQLLTVSEQQKQKQLPNHNAHTPLPAHSNEQILQKNLLDLSLNESDFSKLANNVLQPAPYSDSGSSNSGGMGNMLFFEESPSSTPAIPIPSNPSVKQTQSEQNLFMSFSPPNSTSSFLSGSQPSPLTGSTGSQPSSPAHRPSVMNEADFLNFNPTQQSHSPQKTETKDDTNTIISQRVHEWSLKGGQEANIRSLLSTIQEFLWPDSGWVPVNLSELLDPKNVRKYYRKAITIVHPDKVQLHGSPDRLFLAQRIFEILNRTFETFKKEL